MRVLIVFILPKKKSWTTSDDITQLRRLGSKVNVTAHESQFDANKYIDVKVNLGSVNINIRYGMDPHQERARLLRHFARIITRNAWAKEKDIINRFGKGTIKWNSHDIKQLRTAGAVEGWEVVYKKPPSKYPELATDMKNVMIVKTGKHHQ